MRTLIASLALATLVAACATPTPYPSAVQSAAPSTSASTPVPVGLAAAGTVRESCGSIGGCAYYINIDGPNGSWKAEFGYDGDELGDAKGLPATIATGTYTITLSSVMVSDAVLNGVRQFGPTDATCSTTLNVRGDQPISIHGWFDDGSCEADVNA